MKKSILEKYAQLLVEYCLEIKEGERCYLRSSTLAEPLVKELYQSILNAGGHPEIELSFQDKNQIFLTSSNDQQLGYIPTLFEKAMKEFEAYLVVRAPFNLREDQNVPTDKRFKRAERLKPVLSTYFKRTGDGSMKRCLCQYPTNASAQEAGMSFGEYENFVFNACHLFANDPAAEWKSIRAQQQRIVDFLNSKSDIRYQCNGTDISFSVKDRIWINSDGRSNMPSGEVFTGPVEESVSGVVHFNYPSIYMGKEVSGITLWVKNGKVEKWEADKGAEILDEVFKIEGARYFGEVAIGTNYNIQQATKNILFDEKIGGTIHMAVGQSYFNTGGRNESSIHWDMISDMKDGGQIFADGEKIYENGKFIIF